MSDASEELMAKAGCGDQAALDALLEQYRDRLRRMVSLRLNRKLRGRVDASDVLQEAYLEIAKHLADYLRDPPMPFYLWLRHITQQQLIVAHRRHLGAQMRDAAREVSLHQGPLPEAASASLAAQLLGKLTSPSVAAVKAELQLRLQEALNQMAPLDREILVLRHFEQLTNSEAAVALDIDSSAASNRYVRAIKRLKAILADAPEFGDSASG